MTLWSHPSETFGTASRVGAGAFAFDRFGAGRCVATAGYRVEGRNALVPNRDGRIGSPISRWPTSQAENAASLLGRSIPNPTRRWSSNSGR